jgi:membrane associated rhomboid family serine protease
MASEHHDNVPVELQPKRCRVPVATIVVLVATAVVSIVQFYRPALLDLLGRRPGTLADREWWRLVTPLFVHSSGWPHLLFNLAWIGLGGTIVERLFGGARWVVLYFVPGIIGELIAMTWKPVGGGASLGGSGLLGALFAWLVLRGEKLPWRVRFWGPLGLAAAAALTFRHEIHGPPMLAGTCLAALMLPRINHINQRNV